MSHAAERSIKIITKWLTAASILLWDQTVVHCRIVYHVFIVALLKREGIMLQLAQNVLHMHDALNLNTGNLNTIQMQKKKKKASCFVKPALPP